ncbi:MAG: 50S ribosomal protein L28, partial [Planctomycetes bacterium]|nr:50S ribosomal protein L28 [Planctomycetota bacterium]
MPASCAICGKTGSFGNTITTRGEPKRKGGFGLKVTGINRRRWQPNLHKQRVIVNGAKRRLRICARCIKSDTVQ